jgi:hypothetical protein
VCSFACQHPDEIGCITNEFPCIVSPCIGFRQEEIRKGTRENAFALPRLLCLLLPFERIFPSRSASPHVFGVYGSSFLSNKHIAVLTTLAKLVATHPEIERILVRAILEFHLHFIKPPLDLVYSKQYIAM